ncbi:unnamed protein product [Rotaria socialis]
MQIHQQVSIEEAIPDVIFCDKHSKKSLEYWCHTCEKVICVDCLLINHKNHEYSSKDDVTKELETKISTRLYGIQSSLEYRINQADSIINETITHCQSSRLQITEAIASLREIINTHERNMLEKISATEQEQKKQLEDFKNPLKNELQNLNMQKAIFEILVTSNNHTKILQIKKDFDNYIHKTKGTLKSLQISTKTEFSVQGLDQLQFLKQEIEQYGKYIQIPAYHNSELEQFISQNRKKQKMNLNNRNLNDSDMKILTLTELSLEKNRIGQQGAQYIADALRMNQTLTTLCLDTNQIGQRGAEHIADALKTNRTLTTLYLGENQIGQYGARHIAEALKTNRTLTTLGLEQNQIGQKGTEYIADALQVNETLNILSLDQNHIGQQGSQQIADAVKVNQVTNVNLPIDITYYCDRSIQTLTILYLNENQIEQQGIEHIANAIKINKTITDLGLKHNQIGQKGAQYLADALKMNKTLTDIGLQQNLIGQEGAQYIADALRINQTLTALYLGENQIGQQGAQHIVDVLKINQFQRTSLFSYRFSAWLFIFVDLFDYVEQEYSYTTKREKLALLLKFQDISNVDFCLDCNDAFEILSFDSNDLLDLKKEMYEIEQQFVCILHRVKCKMHLLKNALVKLSNQLTRTSKTSSNTVIRNSPSTTNLIANNFNNSANTFSVTSMITSASPNNNLTPEEKLKQQIIESLNDWCQKLKENNGQKMFQLKENVDYEIFIDIIGKKILVKCQCGKTTTLAQKDNTFNGLSQKMLPQLFLKLHMIQNQILLSDFYLPLDSNGLPIQNSYSTDSFTRLEEWYSDITRATLLNAYLIQPLSSSLNISPYIFAAYGTDNKFESSDVIFRWYKIYQECKA